MRKGRREILAGLVAFLIGTVVEAAPPAPPPHPQGGGPPVRLTVELTWRMPPLSPSAAVDAGLDLELSEGRVLDALAWPPGGSRGGPKRLAQGWRLGTELAGKVRARIEAPLGASLSFRWGGQVVRLPLLSVLDGPQRLAAQPSLEIGVERLAWDAIAIGLDRSDGTAAPGAVVPVSVGFNVLTPEPTDVGLSGSVELVPSGGGEPVWRQDIREVVSTDRLEPSFKVWNVPMPLVEGTYVLKVSTSWEPLADRASTRLGRWIRRLGNPSAATEAVRRVSLAVIAPGRVAVEGPPGGAEQEVEFVDLGRLRGQRPSASGRMPVLAPGGSAWPVPEAALVRAARNDRLLNPRNVVRGLITRAGSEAAILPPADPSGLAWSALGLKVPRPGRPHRLSVTVTGGQASALGVALVEAGEGHGQPRIVLDACATGPPILEGGPITSFSWLVWPEDPDPVLVLVNRDSAAPVQLGTVALAEIDGLPAPPSIMEPSSGGRGLGLYLARPELVDRFGGGTGVGDSLALALNLTRYLAYCGASVVVLPEGLGERSRRRRLDGQSAEDPIGPDRLDLLLRILGRQGFTAWLELSTEGPLPGLPPPDSAEALARGLVRVNRRGLVDGPAYHPLHPEVREALKRRVAEAIGARNSRPALTGLLIRLGPGPTLLGEPDTGLDDVTFARFVRENFGPETTRNIPGLGTTDPNRFADRSKYLAGPGRMPWLSWRSRGVASLYGELAETARRTAAGALLAVATPGLDDGPAGAEARRVDLAGLPPNQAWRAVGLDLEAWPTGDAAPIVLRGVSVSADELAHDLATSPELDAPVAARPGRGLLAGFEEPAAQATPARPRPGDSGLRLTALPTNAGTAGDELMGHAVAVLDARWVLLGPAIVAGYEERVRGFARVFRALPAVPAARPAPGRPPFGVTLRTLPTARSTYLSLANDSPYPVRIETLLGAGAAAVDDLGRGLRLAPQRVEAGKSRLVLDLLPYGVAAIRVGSTQVTVGPVTPYPSEAVLTGMQARYEELSAQLSRLSRGPAGGLAGPSNPGFEPSSTPLVQLTGARGPAAPAGWQLVGMSGTATAEIDPAQPHGGRGSLRLEAQAAPAAVLSEDFPARAQSALTVQAWFRSARPDAKVRVWIEGEGAGPPYRRWSELTVQPDWAVQAIRGSELPVDGLDAARIRIELLTSGTLWVDDLRVSGDPASESERQNARRVLLAALHAYREKRYADFARLASSHWARSPGAAAEGSMEPSAADREEMIRTGKATALPSNRLLR